MKRWNGPGSLDTFQGNLQNLVLENIHSFPFNKILNIYTKKYKTLTFDAHVTLFRFSTTPCIFV